MSNAKYTLERKLTPVALKKNLQIYHFIWIHGALIQSTINGAVSKTTSTV